jgi:hypothetical protein
MSANTYSAKIGRINYPEHLKDSDRIQRQLDVKFIEAYLTRTFEDKHKNKVKELETEFRELAEQWYLDTLHLTAYWETVLHPSYQSIIGLGREVIPFILRELQDFHAEWFWALQVLSREEIIAKEIEGNHAEMAKAWLSWGERKGYI